MIPFGDQSCFVTVNCSICLSFDSKYPFASNDVLAAEWNKLPSLIFEECIKLNIHGLTPVWMLYAAEKHVGSISSKSCGTE
jgi:hypothetical protein